jgi:hypothetical protein
LIFAHYDGATWQKMGEGAVSTGVNSCTILGTGFTSYSPIAPASANGDNPLPIELLSFTAYQLDDKVKLEWITATEINNDYFTIERSINAVDFEPIEYLNSKAAGGFSNQNIYYQTFDNNPLSGVSYYRLKQTDFDGTFSYSEIISVNYINSATVHMQLFPNPSDGNNINLVVNGLEANSNARIIISDLMGRIVYNDQLNDINGFVNMRIDFQNKLNSGVYIFILDIDGKRYNEKIIIE